MNEQIETDGLIAVLKSLNLMKRSSHLKTKIADIDNQIQLVIELLISTYKLNMTGNN